jgi:hypothetical protein
VPGNNQFWFNQMGQLTPQENFLYQHHLKNLYGSGKTISPGGDISTVLQAVVPGPGGRYYNIPTVWDGQALTTDESMSRAAALGWHQWPSYATPEQADLRYDWMHGILSRSTDLYRALGQGQAPTSPRQWP